MHEAKLSAEDEAPPIGDWTQWRGPRRDGISRETGLNLDWSAGPPPLLWKKPIHGGYSSVAVSDGRAYITDREHKNERVVCLDATTGDELWVYSYPNDYRGLEFGEGPRSDTDRLRRASVYSWRHGDDALPRSKSSGQAAQAALAARPHDRVRHRTAALGRRLLAAHRRPVHDRATRRPERLRRRVRSSHRAAGVEGTDRRRRLQLAHRGHFGGDAAGRLLHRHRPRGAAA